MNVVFAKLLALVFSILILANAYIVRRMVGTWVFPACIFSLFWFVYTFLPLAILFNEPVNPWPVAYLFLCTGAFSLSSLIFFSWKPAFQANCAKQKADSYFNTSFLRSLCYFSSGTSLVLFLINMRIQGFSIEDLVFNSVDTASKYAILRSNDLLSSSLTGKIGMVLSYLAVTTGGLLFGGMTSKTRSSLVFVCAFTPAVAALLFQSAKGLLFLFIPLFFAGVLITRLFHGRLYLFDSATVRKGLFALLVLIPLTAISFLSRGLYGVTDRTVAIRKSLAYFESYAFGHLYAFSDWFSFHVGLPAINSYTYEPKGYGFYTFTSFFNMLGTTRTTPRGVYADYFTNGDLLTTNIFTMFRGLIIDFGIPGTVLYMFVSGVAIHLAYYFLLVTPRPVISVAIFIFSFGYFYSSAFASLLAHNVIPVSIIVLSVALFANRITFNFRPAIKDREKQL
jgi:oligosaccharide repeat unit polymerase